MGEQSVRQPIPPETIKPESKKTGVVDVVKIGDSERRRPEEARAVGVVGATMEFLGDLGKANLAAKKELGEMASTRVGKALAVGVVGAGLESLSTVALGAAFNMLLPKLPVGSIENSERVKSLFNSSLVQEILADSASYVMYQKGNEFLGKELPKIPSSYLGSSAIVNVLDWAVRRGLRQPEKKASYKVDVKDLEVESGQPPKREFALSEVSPGTSNERSGIFPKIGRTAGKIADFSNPVTLFGAAQVIEGVSAYVRAVGEIRNARKAGGAMKVDAILEEAKKAKTVGAAKRDKQERFLDLYEKMVKDE